MEINLLLLICRGIGVSRPRFLTAFWPLWSGTHLPASSNFYEYLTNFADFLIILQCLSDCLTAPISLSLSLSLSLSPSLALLSLVHFIYFCSILSLLPSLYFRSHVFALFLFHSLSRFTISRGIHIHPQS